jgi:5-hydroxyisourate hydrolase
VSITTHVLDTSLGLPASGVPVVLDRADGSGVWVTMGSGETDSDGRLTTLIAGSVPLAPGVYRLTFDTRQYFTRIGTVGFFPAVTIVFDVQPANVHYHVPLLLSPFGYSTYRGS